MLPFMGLAASAAESPQIPLQPLPSEPLQYPLVGFDPPEISDSEELDSEGSLKTISQFAELTAANLIAIDLTPNIDRNLETYETGEQLSLDLALDLALETTEPAEVTELSPPDSFEVNNISIDQAPVLGTLFVELQLAEASSYHRDLMPTLVMGAEDGVQAVAFDQWLLPFDDVNKLLGFTTTLLADGQLELRSPEVITHVQLESLHNDPTLGVMWSIAEVESYLGASAEFDITDYTVTFNRETSHQVQTLQASTSGTLSAENYAASIDYLSGLAPDLLLSEVSEASDNSPSLDQSPVKEQPAESLQNSEDPLPVLDSAPVSPAPISAPIPIEVAPDVAPGRAESQAAEAPNVIDQAITAADLGVMLVGLTIDEFVTVEATLVKGREDGRREIALDQWLLPFDDMTTALGINVTRQPGGLLELRSPGLATSIDPTQLTVDPDLGLAISIAQIETELGIPADFSLSDYAIHFRPPALDNPIVARSRVPIEDDTRPVITEGLPGISPAPFALSGVSQSTRVNGSASTGLSTPTGQLSAVGTALGGSWYVQLDQSSVIDFSGWQLKEFQYVQQNSQSDYVLGTQPVFWPTQSSAQSFSQTYWGATTIQRFGFEPPETGSQGGFSANHRLRANAVDRTVSGEASPGTLVRLTRGIHGSVIGETIVDSSGVYRFEDIPVQTRNSSRYQVELYPDGQLTSVPEIRAANFLSLSGQLPEGASALVASAGVGHRRQSGQLLGDFNTFRGGVGYRYGLSESLTMGGALVQDGSTQGVLEAFYLPVNVPLQAAVSANVELGSGEAQILARARYQPSKDLRITFNSDRFSQRLNADWRLSPQLTLLAAANSRERAASVGARWAYQLGKWYGNLDASIDTRQNLRWGLNTTNRQISFTSRGNEVSTYSEVAYQPDDAHSATTYAQLGHELAISYETSGFGNSTGRLATASWRYRSRQLLSNGRSRWNSALGYGIGSQGSGIVASASAALTQGLDLEMRYQSISPFSEADSFRLSLVSRLRPRNNADAAIGWGHRYQNRLRTQGGILLQPFVDSNHNNRFDPEELIALEDPGLLAKINNRSLENYQYEVHDDGIALFLPPDTYRIDLLAAGLPINSTVEEMSQTAETTLGQYTLMPIQLMSAYTVSGVVVDQFGRAMPGVMVEAISESGDSRLSLTNGAGVYYLERLHSETYDIKIDGVIVESATLSLEDESELYQQREIRLSQS